MNFQNEATELIALQETFAVPALGYGNNVVGWNLLGAMACTLANLAPADGSVVDHDSRAMRLGTSILVHGGASAGWVVDEFIGAVSQKQVKLNDTCQTFLEWLANNKNNPKAILPEDRSQIDVANLFLQAWQTTQPLIG